MLKKQLVHFDKINITVDSIIGMIKRKQPLNDEEEFKIKLISKELLDNIFSYSDASEVLLTADFDRCDLVITIEDDSSGFEHKSIMGRDVKEDDFLMQVSGRGLFLAKMMSQEVKFNDKGNAVEVKIKL